jgi:HNH endonuclease
MDWVERYWSYVDKSGECWLWTGGRTPEGYGKFWLNGKTVLAHRAGYALAHGKLPDVKHHLDHLCRIRSCVRPEHIEPVTIRENLMRGPTTFAAINAAKTHCRNGHEYTEANTYRPPDGSRMCRECSRAKDRRAYWRNKRHLADPEPAASSS